MTVNSQLVTTVERNDHTFVEDTTAYSTVVFSNLSGSVMVLLDTAEYLRLGERDTMTVTLNPVDATPRV
jgi:hypothetical protein